MFEYLMPKKKRQTMAEKISHRIRTDAKVELKDTNIGDDLLPNMPASASQINVLFAAQNDSQAKIDSIDAELEALERRKEYLRIERKAYLALQEVGNKYVSQLKSIKVTITTPTETK